jgi:hypothetical protein
MPQDSLTHAQLGIPDSTPPESALGVTVIEIDQKPLQAALTGLYTKVLTDSHSRDLVEYIQKDQ